jgi:hypothetical protein
MALRLLMMRSTCCSMLLGGAVVEIEVNIALQKRGEKRAVQVTRGISGFCSLLAE